MDKSRVALLVQTSIKYVLPPATVCMERRRWVEDHLIHEEGMTPDEARKTLDRYLSEHGINLFDGSSYLTPGS